MESMGLKWSQGVWYRVKESGILLKGFGIESRGLEYSIKGFGIESRGLE